MLLCDLQAGLGELDQRDPAVVLLADPADQALLSRPSTRTVMFLGDIGETHQTRSCPTVVS